MSLTASVLVSCSGAVGIIELARPDKYNCLSIATLLGMGAALDTFEAAGSGVRAILLRAQGKNFCTGADLDEVLPMREDLAQISGFISLAHAVFNRFEASTIPVVVACQGLALAGGLELMLVADVAFAAHDARFGDQHAQFGLLPGFGGSQRLTRTIGARRAFDLFFSARWIGADIALQWGLVNYVVDPADLASAAMAYCEEIATRSPVGIATMKRLARDGLALALPDGLKLEEAAVPVGLMHADVSEGLAAFQARRTPRFSG